MAINRQTLVVAVLLLVLAVAAIRALGGDSGSGYAPSGDVGYVERTQGGGIGSDGSTFYYVDPDGGSSYLSD